MKIFFLPEEIKGLVFDIDMTLYRNKEYYKDQKNLLVQKLAEKHNKSFIRMLEEIDSFQESYSKKNNGKKISLGNLFINYGVSIKQSCNWRTELFNPEKYLSKDIKLINTLSILKECFSLACITNNTEIIAKRTLSTLGITAFFPIIIGLDRTLLSKPNIKPFNIVSEELGISLSNMISIGDRFEVDIEIPVEFCMGGILVESMEDVYNLPDVLI